MNLKERIDQILQDFNNDDVSLYEDRLEKATTDILKVIELDEEKIAKFMLDYDFEGTNNSFPSKSLVETYRRYAKAITQGDVWKEERDDSRNSILK